MSQRRRLGCLVTEAAAQVLENKVCRLSGEGHETAPTTQKAMNVTTGGRYRSTCLAVPLGGPPVPFWVSVGSNEHPNTNNRNHNVPIKRWRKRNCSQNAKTIQRLGADLGTSCHKGGRYRSTIWLCPRRRAPGGLVQRAHSYSKTIGKGGPEAKHPYSSQLVLPLDPTNRQHPIQNPLNSGQSKPKPGRPGDKKHD